MRFQVWTPVQPGLSHLVGVAREISSQGCVSGLTEQAVLASVNPLPGDVVVLHPDDEGLRKAFLMDEFGDFRQVDFDEPPPGHFKVRPMKVAS